SPKIASHLASTSRAASLSARRSEEHTSELQSHLNLVCRLLLEKKKKKYDRQMTFKCKKNGCKTQSRHARAIVSAVTIHSRVHCSLFSYSCCVICFFFFNNGAPPEFTPFPHHAPLPI